MVTFSPRRVAATAAFLLAVATASFTAARTLQGPTDSYDATELPASASQGFPGANVLAPSPVASRPALAGTPVIGPTPLPPNPVTSQGGWALPYLEADRAKPRNNIMVNGIAVGPSITPAITVACQPGSVRDEPLDQVTLATAGPVFVAPKYAPAGTVRTVTRATFCSNQTGQSIVISTYAAYIIQPDLARGQRGGPFEIYRGFNTPAVHISIPDERWTAGTIAGHPAAIARPILANGLGESAVIIVGNGGILTKLQASGLTLDELLRIAEGLY